jgi:hypothetical protein
VTWCVCVCMRTVDAYHHQRYLNTQRTRAQNDLTLRSRVAVQCVVAALLYDVRWMDTSMGISNIYGGHGEVIEGSSPRVTSLYLFGWPTFILPAFEFTNYTRGQHETMRQVREVRQIHRLYSLHSCSNTGYF